MHLYKNSPFELPLRLPAGTAGNRPKPTPRRGKQTATGLKSSASPARGWTIRQQLGRLRRR